MTPGHLTYSHERGTWMFRITLPFNWAGPMWKPISPADARTLYDAGYRILDAI